MKKIVISVLLSLLTMLKTHAAVPQNGIIVYAEGHQTCYLFEQMPTVTYSNEGNGVVAQLSLQGTDTPVVSLKLEGENKLVVEYGQVEESAISNISTTQHTGRNGKYVVCRRLVIVKDGKLYNSDGTIIEQDN